MVNERKREEARLLNDKYSKLKGKDVFQLDPQEAPTEEAAKKVA